MVQHATNCILAYQGGSFLEQLHNPSLQLQRERNQPWEVGNPSSTNRSIRSFAG